MTYLYKKSCQASTLSNAAENTKLNYSHIHRTNNKLILVLFLNYPVTFLSEQISTFWGVLGIMARMNFALFYFKP